MIRANDDPLGNLLQGQQQLVQEVYDILEAEQKKDDLISAAVLGSQGTHVNHIARLDPERVLSEDAIRSLCITYRLRFLDAGRFKGTLPPRALYELRRLDMRAEEPLKGFKVLAPAARFKLCGGNSDPMLFVAVGPQHYYLVHQWGKSLYAWRAVMAWPLRGPMHLIATVLLFAAVLSTILPNQAVGVTSTAWWGSHRLLAMLWSTMVLASATAFGWLTFFGKFSKEAWNDPRFN